jgi:pSer/pThr/pTyr-binding forkhead associated (FHA) protein
MLNVKKAAKTESFAACLILLKESDIDGSKIDGSMVPETIQIPKDCNIIIGRGAPGVNVTVALSILENDRHIISKQHATISCTLNEDCIIKDLGSVNGVFVNNIKIEEHTLVDG